MLVGTFVLLLFSDPMVDVLNEVGNRISVKPFYIAFILAPLVSPPATRYTASHSLCLQASNASELIAAYNYAAKKTKKTMAVSLSSLTVSCHLITCCSISHSQS